MRITVFGSTGETGVLLFRKALDAGHTVVAFARNPSKLPIQHPKLEVLQGDLADAEKIDAAIQGSDAVISLLGPVGKPKDRALSEGTQRILAAMDKNGVRRLIATATPSFKDPNDRFQFGFAFGVFMVKTLLPSAYLEIVAIGTSIAGSKLDWSLVRLPMLSRKPASGKLYIGYPGDGTVRLFSLSRSDLADFLLRQLEDKTYLRKAPVLSN